MPSFLHLFEGVVPWFPHSFSINWCCLLFSGCGSCSSGHGRATPPPRAQRHRSCHLSCPSATVSPNLLWASPPSHTATLVSTSAPLTHRPPHSRPHAWRPRGGDDARSTPPPISAPTWTMPI